MRSISNAWPVCSRAVPAAVCGALVIAILTGSPAADAFAQDASAPDILNAAAPSQVAAAPLPAPQTAFPTRATGAPEAPPAVIRDGDLGPFPEPVAPRDGIVDLRGPTGLIDGEDPTTVDQRPPEEAALFDNPPAGYDPRLFQIDDIAPRLDRRPRRLFENELYDPVGVAIGSFVFFPEIEIGATSYSNVFSSADAEADRAYDILPSARLVSNWSRHALELRGSADLSSYDEFKTEDDRGFLVEGRGRLDVTRRTNVQAVLSRQRAQESRSAIDAAAAGERASVTTDTLAATGNHRFNRLSLQLRGVVTDTAYAGDDANANADRDVTQKSGALRATWEFKPTLRVFGEVEGQERDFEVAAASDGIKRNSHGARYRGGLEFGSTGAYLRGEVALGYARQDYRDPRLIDVDGVILDANLAWRMNALTTILFTASSDISDTTTTGSSGVLERRVGLEARHAFRTHLIGSAGLGMAKRDYTGIDINETQYDIMLGLDYYLNRDAAILARYQHTAFLSDFIDGDYTADEFRIALRLRR